MEGKTGTENGGDDHIVLGQGDVNGAERGGDGFRLVLQRLRQLVGHDFADALDVVAEEQAVLLILLVAQLCHEAVHDGIPLSKVDNLHRC